MHLPKQNLSHRGGGVTWPIGDNFALRCNMLQGKLTSAGTLVHLKAKAEDLQSRRQDLRGLEDFKAGLQALIDGDDTPLTLLIKGLNATGTMHRSWRWAGKQKSIKTGCHKPPVRNVPVQQRQQLREAQWHGTWQVLDQPKASAEREGIVQARQWEDLDPHTVMKQLSKLPQKACGPDGISYMGRSISAFFGSNSTSVVRT